MPAFSLQEAGSSGRIYAACVLERLPVGAFGPTSACHAMHHQPPPAALILLRACCLMQDGQPKSSLT